MKCPVCKDPALVMAERHGIEIDYCPQCRGVWLDRGELDKIVEQAAAQDVPESRPPSPSRKQEDYRDDSRPYRHPKYDDDYAPHYRRKKKWWTEIFDIG